MCGYVWYAGSGVLNCASSYGSPTPAKEGVENVPNRDIDDLAAHCLSCPPLMAAGASSASERSSGSPETASAKLLR